MNNEKGSSSLMVILIVFTLMLFGVFALMSSYSEFKLSNKYALWVQEYYQLDREAQLYLSELNLEANEGKTIETTITSDQITTAQSLDIKVKVEAGQVKILKWKQNQNSFDLLETETLWDGDTGEWS